MRYIGGKSKIAKELSAVILENSTSRKFYLEPFIGGAAVFPLIAPKFEWSTAGDFHTDLILMWNALIFDGWEPPSTFTEQEYSGLKTAQSSAIRALAGFGGSFGGKWFGGYARGGKNSDGTPRDHQNESVRSALATRGLLRSALTPERLGRFRNQSYADWKPVAGAVIYCDPPYADTQGYSTGGFDSAEFWDTMRRWSALGCEVFVSEYSAPNDFVCIWEKTHRQSLVTPGQGRNLTTERIFTLR